MGLLHGRSLFSPLLFGAPGIQEFVEAASFLHYIRHRSLVSLEDINARLVFVRPEEPPSMVRA